MTNNCPKCSKQIMAGDTVALDGLCTLCAINKPKRWEEEMSNRFDIWFGTDSLIDLRLFKRFTYQEIKRAKKEERARMEKVIKERFKRWSGSEVNKVLTDVLAGIEEGEL